MKFSCTQENLNKTLQIISHIAGRNLSLPILSNILIKAAEKNIVLVATNLEIGVRALLRGKVEKEGEFTSQAKLLNDYVSLLPKERVDLEIENERLKINCGNYQTKINGQAASDFPLLPKVEKKEPLVCAVEELKKGLQQTLFAVSTSETRPEISGVLFNCSKDKLILAATDSYRLAEKEITLKKSISFASQTIVPARTAQEVVRILSLGASESDLSEEDGEVKIYFAENQILFEYGDVEMVSRIVEGQYPDYQQIIPREAKTKLKISREEFVKVAKAASLFTKTGINDVTLEAQGKELVVSSASSQTGENMIKLEAEVEGGGNRVVVNYRYLLDGLQSIASQDVYLEITDNNTPCSLAPLPSEKHLYIIMPIKQ